eukprot:8163827-Lingulodinium_polyedra.AAC.1
MSVTEKSVCVSASAWRGSCTCGWPLSACGGAAAASSRWRSATSRLALRSSCSAAASAALAASA